MLNIGRGSNIFVLGYIVFEMITVQKLVPCDSAVLQYALNPRSIFSDVWTIGAPESRLYMLGCWCGRPPPNFGMARYAKFAIGIPAHCSNANNYRRWILYINRLTVIPYACWIYVCV